ncbi:MAG: NAD(P)-binding domain-containing protein [Alphaproteobacteria bacterium]|nr:NAD(P)-binding domain-containing protein [Alphaproteobacteria bacterium]
MRIAVLGTGMVGRTIASKLVSLGHEVRMGSRTAGNAGAVAWADKAGAGASTGTFADAAAFGEVVFNCVNGQHTLAALQAAGAAHLDGKILLELANPLDFSKGMPPTLFVSNTDSLGEQVQRAFPGARVVKTLNTLNCELMVDPGKLPEPTDVFVSGNDAEAKAQVAAWLQDWFGWQRVIDLGDITTARGTESWLPLWIRLWGALGTANYNLRIVKG